MITNTGLQALLGIMINSGSFSPFGPSAYLGVGDSPTLVSQNQIDLQATTNKLRMVMDSGYPTQTGNNILTFQSTFGAADANYSWQEWGLFNASTGGVMFNRVAEYLGTKILGQTWVLNVTFTFTIVS